MRRDGTKRLALIRADNLYACPVCRARSGIAKVSYVTVADATEEIELRQKYKKRPGHSYACPAGYGFHVAEVSNARAAVERREVGVIGRLKRMALGEETVIP